MIVLVKPVSLIRETSKDSNEYYEQREKSEKALTPKKDNIVLPDAYKKQKQVVALFDWYLKEMEEIDLLTNIDADSLARYCVAEILAQEYGNKMLRSRRGRTPEKIKLQQDISKLHDKYIKQARGLAADIGLTVTSRVKLAVKLGPPEEEPDSAQQRFGDRLG